MESILLPSQMMISSSRCLPVALDMPQMTRIMRAAPEERAAATKLGGRRAELYNSLGTKPKMAPVPVWVPMAQRTTTREVILVRVPFSLKRAHR